MFRLSYTKVHLYEYCAWAYKLRYVDKKRPLFRPRLLLGATVHIAISEFLRRVMEGLPTAWAHMEQIFQRRWRGAATLNAEESEKLRLRGLELLRGFWGANSPDFGHPLLLETRFAINLGQTRLEGIVDRVEDLQTGKVEVIDYKSGSAPEGNAAEHNLQLLIYAMACVEAWSLNPERVSLYYLADNTVQSSNVTAHDIDETRNRIGRTAADIGDGQFQPRIGPHCPDCDYFRACHYGQEWADANVPIE